MLQLDVTSHNYYTFESISELLIFKQEIVQTPDKFIRNRFSRSHPLTLTNLGGSIFSVISRHTTPKCCVTSI